MGVQGRIRRRRAWGPPTRAPSHFGDLGDGGGGVGGFSHSQGGEDAGDVESDKRSWGGWWVAGEELLVE